MEGGKIIFGPGKIQSVRAVPVNACAGVFGGYGAMASSGGDIDLHAFEISRHEGCGLGLGRGGKITARNGTVRDGSMGMCGSSERFDAADIDCDVKFVGNDLHTGGGSIPLQPCVFQFP